MKVRSATQSDVSGMQDVLVATDLFPSEMLPEMISGYLNGGSGPEVWLTAEADGKVAGFCYAVPEKLTDGT